uniref:RxLR effector candidate protein n=1 Tax=Hyaloperonospora arabidopsidis (strain Emoy2) TaxID=559515 RepID=M4B5Z3_HYAAE
MRVVSPLLVFSLLFPVTTCNKEPYRLRKPSSDGREVGPSRNRLLGATDDEGDAERKRGETTTEENDSSEERGLDKNALSRTIDAAATETTLSSALAKVGEVKWLDAPALTAKAAEETKMAKERAKHRIALLRQLYEAHKLTDRTSKLSLKSAAAGGKANGAKSLWLSFDRERDLNDAMSFVLRDHYTKKLDSKIRASGPPLKRQAQVTPERFTYGEYLEREKKKEALKLH